MPAAFERAVDLYVLCAGACVGSFLNVVIARVPSGRSVVSPRSSCPKCGNFIAWYDNLPILSWLLLRARCRKCGQPISARYPLVELLTAILLFAVWRRFGPVPAALGYGAFACALVALTYIDIDTWLLPHQITWPLLALGLLSPLWNARLTWASAGIGGAAGFAFFAAIALVGEKLLHKETMGWGDVWLLAGIGAWLGWRALLPVVLLASIQGAVVGIVLLLTGRDPAKKARQDSLHERGTAAAGAAPASDDDWVPPPHAVPFGPFLALAALEFLLAGEAISWFYFALVQRLTA